MRGLSFSGLSLLWCLWPFLDYQVLNEWSKAKSKESENVSPKYLQPSAGPAKRETTPLRKPVRPKGPLSEWDRRQQLIRERLARFKEQAESAAAEISKSLEPPRKAQAPVESEVLPVAEAIETTQLVVPTSPPVQRLPESRP
jgi:hypothetical protein